MKDNELFWIFSGLFGFLAVATVIGLILKHVKETPLLSVT